jgi:ketosteroid isomerase-like protein
MSEGDPQEFDALLKAWSAAIVDDDADAIDSFVEPEWVLVGETGITAREDFLTSVASGDLTHETMSHEVHRVRIYGNVAVVTARVTNNGTFRGQSFTSNEWNTDVFVSRAGVWRCVLTHLTSAKPGASYATSTQD